MKRSANTVPCAFILLAVSIFSVLFGAYQVALQSVQDVSSYCATEGQLPDDADPYGNYAIGSHFGLFPLGYTCRWQLGEEPTIVAEPNWTVSVLVYGGIAGTIVGAVGTTTFVRRIVRRENDGGLPHRRRLVSKTTTDLN